jgi:hypothetical protein
MLVKQVDLAVLHRVDVMSSHLLGLLVEDPRLG